MLYKMKKIQQNQISFGSLQMVKKIPITKEECEEYAQNYVEQADLRYIEGTQDNIAHISDLWDK